MSVTAASNIGILPRSAQTARNRNRSWGAVHFATSAFAHPCGWIGCFCSRSGMRFRQRPLVPLRCPADAASELGLPICASPAALGTATRGCSGFKTRLENCSHRNRLRRVIQTRSATISPIPSLTRTSRKIRTRDVRAKYCAGKTKSFWLGRSRREHTWITRGALLAMPSAKSAIHMGISSSMGTSTMARYT